MSRANPEEEERLRLFEEPSKDSESKRRTRNKPDSCIFCSIARNEEQSITVIRDDVSVAFLDKRPLFPGHCLLIPLGHYATLSDLPKNLIAPFFSTAQRLSVAVEKALSADGTFVGINNRVSQSVPHLHVHIVPRRARDGLRGFFWPRQKYRTAGEMEETAKKIRSALDSFQ